MRLPSSKNEIIALAHEGVSTLPGLSARNILFMAFNIAFAGIYRDAFALMYGFTESELYSHIVLIPFVSAYFFYSERKTIFTGLSYGAYSGGLLALTGLALFIFGKGLAGLLGQNDYLSLMMLSAFVFWAGGFLFFYGPSALNSAAFPVLFLLFIVPLPSLIIDNAIGALQAASAWAAGVFFSIAGVHYFREGFVFQLPGLNIEVAKECSGIRSSLSLVITGVIAGRLYLRSYSGRALLIAAVLPLTVFKNGLRIAALTLLGIYVDKGLLHGPLHSRGGIPFFLLALLFMGIIVRGIKKLERRIMK